MPVRILQRREPENGRTQKTSVQRELEVEKRTLIRLEPFEYTPVIIFTVVQIEIINRLCYAYLRAMRRKYTFHALLKLAVFRTYSMIALPFLSRI